MRRVRQANIYRQPLKIEVRFAFLDGHTHYLTNRTYRESAEKTLYVQNPIRHAKPVTLGYTLEFQKVSWDPEPAQRPHRGSQNYPELPKVTQSHPELPRGTQKHPEATRGTRRHPEPLKALQKEHLGISEEYLSST